MRKKVFGLALIFSLVLTIFAGLAVTTEAATTSYEAENGTYGGGALKNASSNASGGYVIGNINNVGAYTQISNADGGTGGNATLVIRYSNGNADNRTFSLYVNGVDVMQVSFTPTGSWTTFKDKTVTVSLNAGTSNTIKLQRDSSDYNAVDVDKYTITPAADPAPTPTKLTGTAFGTAPYQGSSSWSYDKAFDGNTSTYFDGADGSASYTGIDLGSGNAKKITKIRYYPRTAYEYRMTGGKFQGSNTSTSSGFVDLYTISSQPAAGTWTEVAIPDATAYRYIRYYGPANGFSNVVEIEFYGTSGTEPTPGSDFWLSGGSRNTNSQSGTTEWGNFRGRDCTFQIAYSTRTAGWSAFVSSHGSSGQISNFTDKSITYLIQSPPFPESTSSTYSELVSGSYDSYWQQIGTQLKNKADAGFNIILSIAWEANGTFMSWGGGGGGSHYSSTTQYIQGYQRIVNQLRVTYPQVETAWIINAHSTPASCAPGGDAWLLYPGDAYVTYIGIDNYDSYPKSLTKTDFDNTANANGGLYWLANHTVQQGKKIIVGEWGINNNPSDVANGYAGGDNANFIQWMYDTFSAWNTSGILKAEYYYADAIDGSNVDSDLIGGNPNSSAKYKSLWKK